MGSIGGQDSRQRSQTGSQEAKRTIGILGNNLRNLQDLWVPKETRHRTRSDKGKSEEPRGRRSIKKKQANKQRSQAGSQEARRTIGILGNNLRNLQDLWVP